MPCSCPCCHTHLQVKGYLKALPRASNFIATADSKAVALWQLLPTETPRNELWAGWTRILAVPPRKVRPAAGCVAHVACCVKSDSACAARAAAGRGRAHVRTHMLAEHVCMQPRSCVRVPHPHLSCAPWFLPACVAALLLPQWGQLVRLELHYEEAHEAIAAAHGAYYYLRCVCACVGSAPASLVLVLVAAR